MLSRVQHNRTPAIYGNLMVALDELMSFAIQVGAVDAVEADVQRERARMAALAAIQAQSEYLGSADPVERYRDLLREALASGNAHVRAPGEEPGPGEHLGWTSPEGTFLYPDVSLSLAKRMAESVGDPLPFSGQTMNKCLYERRWLVATNLDKNRKSIAIRKRVEGRTETVLHLKPEFLEQG